MAINGWFTHGKWWFSIVLLVYQRVTCVHRPWQVRCSWGKWDYEWQDRTLITHAWWKSSGYLRRFSLVHRMWRWFGWRHHGHKQHVGCSSIHSHHGASGWVLLWFRTVRQFSRYFVVNGIQWGSVRAQTTAVLCLKAWGLHVFSCYRGNENLAAQTRRIASKQATGNPKDRIIIRKCMKIFLERQVFYGQSSIFPIIFQSWKIVVEDDRSSYHPILLKSFPEMGLPPWRAGTPHMCS